MMQDERWHGRVPLVAILRGVEPDRAVDVGSALVAAGVSIIEVPMNSPEPLESIARLARSLGGRALIGAGTVLDPADVDRLAGIGASLVVSPGCNPTVIARTVRAGMIALPGVFTPSEMFMAIEAGASGLKIFPAELFPHTALKAVKAVLPDVPVFMVGGIHAGNMEAYVAAGAAGFGIGGSLFQPGKPLADIASDAAALVAAVRAAGAA